MAHVVGTCHTGMRTSAREGAGLEKPSLGLGETRGFWDEGPGARYLGGA